jgi:hypothetical protein
MARLFEDPDPWRRIGIILGLEKEDDVVQRAPGDDNNIQFDMTPTCQSRESLESKKSTIQMTIVQQVQYQRRVKRLRERDLPKKLPSIAIQ